MDKNRLGKRGKKPLEDHDGFTNRAWGLFLWLVYLGFSCSPLRALNDVEPPHGSRNSSGDMSFEELQNMLGSITRAAQGARGSQDGGRLDG